MGWSQHHRNGLIYYAPQHSFRGYTLTTNVGGKWANLLNMEGQVCHRWHLNEGIEYARLLPYGTLLARTAPAEDAGGAERIGGSSAALVELDWDGNVVWSYRNPLLHHDYQRLPNGNTLTLEFERISSELTAQVQGGRRQDTDPEQMFGDVVKEIAPDGSTLHEWKSWEHLDPVEDVICPLEERREWTHGNSINLTADGHLLISFRLTSTIGIVDRGDGHFRWKWGPGEVYHQHHPTELPNGNVLLFDNGGHRPRSTWSRALEVDPVTNRVEWEYRGDPPISFHSPNISSADRLPNGNTLICEGAPGRAFEVTPNGQIVWEYVNPFFAPGGGVAGGNPGDMTNSMFRAHRYAPDYSGLSGRDLDPQRYGNLNRLYAG